MSPQAQRDAQQSRAARTSVFLWNAYGLAILCLAGLCEKATAQSDTVARATDRSPVDLVLLDDRWLVTANQTSNSVSLVEWQAGQVVDELCVGEHPEAVIAVGDGSSVVVSCSWSGTLEELQIQDGKLHHKRSLSVGFLPHGMAFSPDRSTLYVAMTAKDAVAVLDWSSGQVQDVIPVGRWPRHLAISRDGQRLAVAVSGDRSISVIDTQRRQLDFQVKLNGINIGHLRVANDDEHVYFPWTIYRRTPITPQNIRLGWVLGSRVGRVSLRQHQPRYAMPLDVPGQAVADTWGIGLTRDEHWMVISASGTHELLLLRLDDLPLSDSVSDNHLPAPLRRDHRRFARVPLGGRPMGLTIAPDDRTVLVANYLNNSVQVVDLQEQRLVREIVLGGPEAPSPARRGEALFYDATRSLDQWYSCHTCHYQGGGNAEPMDTHNDGTVNTFKTVLPLYHLPQTGPWTWHGWQKDLRSALATSLTSTMQGPQPTDAELDDLIAFLAQLPTPPNPHATTEANRDAIERGRALFLSDRAGCSLCHSGPYFTDGQIHDVGLGSPNDRYRGFNTPSLVRVYERVRLLHDGRAKSLEELLRGPHAPEKVAGEPLSDQELADLVAFLRTL